MIGATHQAGIFAGFPIVVDTTLPPDHIAIVSEGRRIVFRLDLFREEAIEVFDSAKMMTRPEIEAWISACNYEPARQLLRHYLQLVDARQA
jgi:hypothetical protein